MNFSITADIVIAVVILFWALAAPTLSPSDFTLPIIYHLHLVNFILLLIDIFLVAIPVRLFHVVYTVATILVYLLATLILHWLGIVSGIYPDVLVWQRYPTKSVIICLIGFVLVIVAHVIVFALYKLRMYIYFRKYEESQSPNRASELPQNDNETGVIQTIQEYSVDNANQGVS